MTNNLSVRYKLKTDTSQAYTAANTLIPLDGEPIIVSDNDKKLKIGNGVSKAADLPYLLDTVPVEKGTGTNSIQQTGAVSTATGKGAVALGEGTKASKNNTVALGAYNLEDSNTYVLTVGNGNSSQRTNALTVDKNGNLWFSGNIKVGGTGWDSADALELATKSYVTQNAGSNSYHIKTQDALHTFQANGISGNSATASYATAMGVGTSATAAAATAIGAYTQAVANNSIAMGHTTKAAGNSAVASGKHTEASGNGAISGGYHPDTNAIFAKGAGSIAIGSAESTGTITANGRGAVAIGLSDKQILAEGPGAISMGRDNYVKGYGAVSLGSYNTVMADNSVVTGVNSFCYAPRSYVQGSANYAGVKGFYLVGVADTEDGLGLNFYFDSVQPTMIVHSAVNNSLNITQYWPTSEIAQYIIYFSDSYMNLILEGLITTSQNYITVKYNTEEEKNEVLASIPFDTEFSVKQNITFSAVMMNYLGYGLVIFGSEIHAEGDNNAAWSSSVHIEGTRNIGVGSGGHIEGADNIGFGNNSHVEGQSNIARGNDSHCEGRYSTSIGDASHAEGGFAQAQGPYSHAEGYYCTAFGRGAHAEGRLTTARNDGAHAEGNATFASGSGAHAEGTNQSDVTTDDLPNYDFVLSDSTIETVAGPKANHRGTHAEGIQTLAHAYGSHAEGKWTLAEGKFAHAGGEGSIAAHRTSFASGTYVTTGKESQTVLGAYNAVDTDAQLVVGAGTSEVRENVFTCGKTTDSGDKWITIGNTKITETQLQSLLNLLEN